MSWLLLLASKHIFCTWSPGEFCISKIKTKNSSKFYRKKTINQRTSVWWESIRKLPPEGLSRYRSQASKEKTRSSYSWKMLQDSPCGFLPDCSEYVFKANSMWKSEMCVCKWRGGGEAVHSPIHHALHRCQQLFSLPHSKDEWKIIQQAFFVKLRFALKLNFKNSASAKGFTFRLAPVQHSL